MKTIYLYSEIEIQQLNHLVRKLDSDLVTVDDLSKFSITDPAILVLNQSNVENLNEILRRRTQKVLIGINDRNDFKFFSKLINDDEKIFGFIDLTQELEFNIPICLNYLNLNFSKHSLGLSALEKDLNKMLEFTKSELERVKDLHDKVVKIRQDDFKGIIFTSKFMAGEKSGGEFFDFIDKDNEIIFFQLGSDSYYSSAMLISEIEKVKLSAKTLLSVQVAESVIQSIWNMMKEHSSKINYNIFIISKKSLEITLRSNGEGQIFYDKKIIELSEGLQFKLKPKSKMLILSKGVLKNWNELNSGENLEKILNKNIDTTRDQITEIFYELSKNKKGMFLTYDALVVAVEVSPNTIYQLN